MFLNMKYWKDICYRHSDAEKECALSVLHAYFISSVANQQRQSIFKLKKSHDLVDFRIFSAFQSEELSGSIDRKLIFK